MCLPVREWTIGMELSLRGKNNTFFKISTLPEGVFISVVDETMTFWGIYSVGVFINWLLKRKMVENTNPLERRLQ